MISYESRHSNDQSVCRDRSRTILYIHNSNATIEGEVIPRCETTSSTEAFSLGHVSLYAIWSIIDDEMSKSYKNPPLGTIDAPNCYLLDQDSSPNIVFVTKGVLG